MTVTEAPRATSVEAAAPTLSAPPTGLAAVVGSAEPRTVGRLFVGTSLLFLVAAAVVGALVGIEQYDSAASDIMGADTAVRLFTLHETTLLTEGRLQPHTARQLWRPHTAQLGTPKIPSRPSRETRARGNRLPVTS